MKQELVPYKIALELKVLGFDEPCQLGWYLPHSEIAIKAGVEPNFWQLIPTHPLLNQIAAPTFSQSFRFFREKYDIQYWFHDGGYIGKVFIKITGYKHDKFYFSSSEPMEYEEAEIESLKKLIEIVKKK